MQENIETRSEDPVYSEFAGDPEFVELLEMFAESTTEKRTLLQASFAAGDFDAVKTYAHQLKGAGGGYGFPGLTVVAGELEETCKDPDADRIEQMLNQVLQYLGRVSI